MQGEMWITVDAVRENAEKLVKIADARFRLLWARHR
jgi:hypothetical protein